MAVTAQNNSIGAIGHEAHSAARRCGRLALSKCSQYYVKSAEELV
jgi:ribosomal protein L37E